ncbi:MAG TPA: MASE1 domain-containing protein [Xanthobacteraceae bacterium]|nr:MASE1 domain-containing protein [Xanthobacteraceae bacterium]
MSQHTTYSDAVASSLRLRLPGLKAALQAPLLVAFAYFIGAEIAFYIGTLSDKIFAPFWPPNIILFCALVVVPERRWWLFIAACFPAHVMAELQVGMPAAQMLVAFATNCAVALLNAAALRHLLGTPPSLGDLRKASLYILVTAGFSPALVALGGAFVPILGGGPLDNYWLFWTNWYLSNALTGLTLGPVFLTWLSESPKSSALAATSRMAEAALLAVALVVVCAIAFEASAGRVGTGFLPALLYSPLPFILWATLRFGEKGASGAILIVTVALIWRTLKGPSLFIGADPETNVLALQLFLTGLAIPVLLLGATIDELRRTEQITRELAGSVLTAQDQERRRIARELHDTTGQNLIAATMLLGRVRDTVPESAKSTVSQLDDMLRQSVDDVRTVSYLLHPPLLDEAGLNLALRHYVDGLCQRSSLAIDLAVSPDIGRLPSDMEMALFRVVQEALTNVSRHSGSTTARINLRRGMAKGQHAVILSIEDAGKGMTLRRPGRGPLMPRPVRGVGLASMRERLRQIGGWLDIESEVGRTVVTAVVPDRSITAGAGP